MRWLFYTFWIIPIVGALLLSGIALQYFDFDPHKHFLGGKLHLHTNPIWMTAFYVHLGFGALVTLVGIPLFFSKIIGFRSKLHKQLGKVYIISILCFTGPTGIYLAFFAEGGWLASVGFLMMSAAWMIPTYIAFRKVIQGDIQGHYNWIIRSYCMTLSGVTLRLFTPLGSMYFEFDYELNFVLSAFIPWIVNLILGEIIVYFNRNRYPKIIAL